jgi:hypothetical protein
MPLRIAAGYEASGDEEAAQRRRVDAEAAARELVAPFQPVPPDLEKEEYTRPLVVSGVSVRKVWLRSSSGTHR